MCSVASDKQLQQTKALLWQRTASVLSLLITCGLYQMGPDEKRERRHHLFLSRGLQSGGKRKSGELGGVRAPDRKHTGR